MAKDVAAIGLHRQLGLDALLASGLTVAEKFDLGLDFGWRSGSPLQSADIFHAGFSR